MANHRRFELDELTNRPGTYFNPQTEVLLIVDDTPDVDHELFGTEEFEADEWVLISDETPLDEHQRDELIERFQHSHQGSGELDDDEVLDDEEDELEPDEDEEEALSPE